MNLPKLPGIYIITNKVDGKVWIGQGKGISKGREGIHGRVIQHLDQFKRGKNSSYLQKAWDKYGSETFTFEVLLLCPYEQCDYWEDYFIEIFQSWKRDKGYNLDKCSRGEGRVSDETKRKISSSLKGRPTKPRSEETKRKLSEALRGRKFSSETKQRIAESRRGKLASEETKLKMSQTRKGRPSEKRGKPGHAQSEETKRRISEAQKGVPRKKPSEEARRKMSEAHKKRSLKACENSSSIQDS